MSEVAIPHATTDSLREAAHVAVATHYGIRSEVVFDTRGLPARTKLYGLYSPRQRAVIALAGGVAVSEGSMEAALASLSEDNKAAIDAYAFAQDDAVEALQDLTRSACYIVRVRWPEIVAQALAWDADAELTQAEDRYWAGEG